MKLKWVQNIDSRIEGINIVPASQGIKKGVKEIVIYTEYGHSQGGGGTAASAEEFLDGKFWEHILSNHSDEVLEEVICTVKVLFDMPANQTRSDSVTASELYTQHLKSYHEANKDFIQVNAANVKAFWQKKADITTGETTLKVTHKIRILKNKIMLWRCSQDIDANYACVLLFDDFLKDTAVSHRIIKDAFGEDTFNEVFACTQKIMTVT